MNHRTKTDGEDEDQGLHAVADHPVFSRPAAGELVSLGEAAQSVVLRLRTRLPRVKVALVPVTGGESDRDQL